MNFFSGHNMANEVLGHMSPSHMTEDYLRRTCPSFSAPVTPHLIVTEEYIPPIETKPFVIITKEVRDSYVPPGMENIVSVSKYRAEQAAIIRKAKYSDEDSELAKELLESGCRIPFGLAKKLRDEWKYRE